MIQGKTKLYICYNISLYDNYLHTYLKIYASLTTHTNLQNIEH